MKITDAVSNEDMNLKVKEDIISLKSFNEDSIEPMIKTSKEDNEFLIIKIGKNIIKTIKKIEEDISEQTEYEYVSIQLNRKMLKV